MITIFCYHSISNDKNDIYAISPNTFRNQLLRIKKQFQIISILEIPPWIENNEGKNLACITFDDGFLDFFTNAYPIISELKIPTTVFIPTKNIGGKFLEKETLQEKHIKILSKDSLITIGSHAHNHTRLDQLTETELKNEFKTSQDTLQNITGKKISAIAYPFGKTNKTISTTAKKYFSLGFGTEGLFNKKILDVMEIPRFIMSKNVWSLKFWIFTNKTFGPLYSLKKFSKGVYFHK